MKCQFSKIIKFLKITGNYPGDFLLYWKSRLANYLKLFQSLVRLINRVQKWLAVLTLTHAFVKVYVGKIHYYINKKYYTMCVDNGG